MYQSEFLELQARARTRAHRKELLDSFMNLLALVACALMLTLGLIKYVEGQQFDYGRCDHLVAKGNLATASIPADYQWKDITTTPGGNWCIATDLND